MIIYVFCQGFVKAPSGGVRVLFDIVNTLNQLGYTSKLLIPNGSYTLDWLESNVDVCNQPDTVTSEDIVIFPEETLWMFDKIVNKAKCKHIIINQGAQWSLANELGYNITKQIYHDALGVIVNSINTQQLVERLFGSLPFHRIHLPVSDSITHPNVKTNKICYMPRRNIEVVKCITQYVRDVHSEWELVAIDNMPYKEVVEILSSSKIFLSFGGPEGFGLPPLEAALSGCKVIGYHGFGGEEFFNSPLLSSIPYMDIPLFLDVINEQTFFLSEKLPTDIPGVVEQIKRLKDTYNYPNFTRDIKIAFEQMIL